MKALSIHTGRQRGLVIVMLVLVLVVLLGVAALALDLGRLYVLRSEMQNAADAAALAGAAELDGDEDAIERARLAAQRLLEHDSHFATVNGLIGEGISLDMTFYCSIGGSNDEPARCPEATDPDDDRKRIILSDNEDPDAHYIKVVLNPEGNEDRYGIDLYFLPVLSVIGIDASRHAVARAEALAGRHFYFCNYPPVMLCDPFEGVSGGMRGNLEAGQQILLKTQSNTWAPGIFAFLDLDLFPGGGAGDAMHALADEGNLGCAPPVVRAEPGGMTNKTAAGINTRLGEYRFGLRPSDYPPSPNITSYGGYDDTAQSQAGEDGKAAWRDDNLKDLDALDLSDPMARVGSGDWDRDNYFDTYHADIAEEARPSGWQSWTRKQVYDWEIAEDLIPVEPTDTAGDSDRRVFHVAVLSCDALNVGPSESFAIREPDGFAKLFITERVAGPPDTNVFVEYIEWSSERDNDYHAAVQLYE